MTFCSDLLVSTSRPGTYGTGGCAGGDAQAGQRGVCWEGAGSHCLLALPSAAASTGSPLPCDFYTTTVAAVRSQLPVAALPVHEVPRGGLSLSKKSPCKEAKSKCGEGNGDAQRKHSVSGLMARNRRLWSCSRSLSEDLRVHPCARSHSREQERQKLGTCL